MTFRQLFNPERIAIIGATNTLVIDRKQLSYLIFSLSECIPQRPWIDQIDINLIIATDTQFLAVDVRIHIR